MIERYEQKIRSMEAELQDQLQEIEKSRSD